MTNLVSPEDEAVFREIFGPKLEDEQPVSSKVWSWPFAHEVIPRQVERQELIDKQYAHIPPKVKW